MEVVMRVCKDCNRDLPETAFYYSKADHRYLSRCKGCQSTFNKKSRSNPDAQEKIYQRSLTLKAQLYKLDRELCKELLEKALCCHICGTPFEKDSEKRIDHCHITDKVRGILCNSCNIMLGFAKDNINTLKNAERYLRRFL